MGGIVGVTLRPSRRIGGLESLHKGFVVGRVPSRRIGGLEKNVAITRNQRTPSRRIGGLESNFWRVRIR